MKMTGFFGFGCTWSADFYSEKSLKKKKKKVKSASFFVFFYKLWFAKKNPLSFFHERKKEMGCLSEE